MKRTKNSPVRREPTEAEIQHAAYMLWIEEGRPEGADFEHWMQAKSMLMHRHGRDAGTKRRAIEIPAPVRAATHDRN